MSVGSVRWDYRSAAKGWCDAAMVVVPSRPAGVSRPAWGAGLVQSES